MAGTNPVSAVLWILVSAVLWILLTMLLPPVGVFLIADCGADFFINICLTFLGLIPGLIHAFYLGYIYFDRRRKGHMDQMAVNRAAGVFSENVQSGGHTTYGTLPY